MKLNVSVSETWLEHWPQEYYRLDAPSRKAALEEQLRRYPDSADEKRRKELFEKRFSSRYDDTFMLAWMMLKVADAQDVNIFTRTRFRYDVETELKRLCVIDEVIDDLLVMEWKSFAENLILTYVNSPSYRSAVFGMGQVSERNTALRLAHEIKTVTLDVPARVGLQEKAAPFRNVMCETYAAMIPDGRRLLQEVQLLR